MHLSWPNALVSHGWMRSRSAFQDQLWHYPNRSQKNAISHLNTEFFGKATFAKRISKWDSWKMLKNVMFIPFSLSRSTRRALHLVQGWENDEPKPQAIKYTLTAYNASEWRAYAHSPWERALITFSSMWSFRQWSLPVAFKLTSFMSPK